MRWGASFMREGGALRPLTIEMTWGRSWLAKEAEPR